MRILPRRFWWMALLGLVTNASIGLQILIKSTLVQAQTVQLLPSHPLVRPVQWVDSGLLENNVYPDADSACDGYLKAAVENTNYTVQATQPTEYLYGNAILGTQNDIVGAVCNFRVTLPDIGQFYDASRTVELLCKNEADGTEYIYSGGSNGVCVESLTYKKIKPYLDKLLPLFIEPNCSNKPKAIIPCIFYEAGRSSSPSINNAENSLPYLIAEALKDGYTDPQIAYLLATAQAESKLGYSMEEATDEDKEIADYWKDENRRKQLGNIEEADAVWFEGHGFGQLTGRGLHEDFSKKLNIDLINHPQLANDPSIAAAILAQGMRDGTFTKTTKISDFINSTKQDFVNARTVVNGHNQAEPIAQIAQVYLKALGSNK